MSATKGQFFQALIYLSNSPYVSPAAGSLQWVRTGTATPAPTYADHSGGSPDATGHCQTDNKGNLRCYLDTDLGPLDLVVAIQVAGGPVIGTPLIVGYEIADLDPQVQPRFTEGGAILPAGTFAAGTAGRYRGNRLLRLVNGTDSAFTPGGWLTFGPVPRTPSAYKVPLKYYGDSYTNSNGGLATPILSAFPYRLADRLGTLAIVQLGTPGTRSDQIAATMLANEVPGDVGIVGISDLCINDEKQAGDLSGLATTTEGARAAFAAASSVSTLPYSSSVFQFGPGWALGISSTAGAYVDIAWLNDTAYLALSFVTGTGGVFAVKNAAGTTVATVNTGGWKYAFTGVLKIPGLGAGTHTLRGSVVSGTVGIVSLLVPNPTPKPVLWFQPGGFVSATENTRLATYIAAAASVLPDFPNVIPVPVDANWNPVTMLAPDGIHLNDLGNSYVADLHETALTGRDFSQGQNITGTATTYTPPTPTFTSTNPAATVPAQVTGFTATTGQQVSFTWTTATDGGSTLTSYLLESSPHGANTWTTVATPAATATSLTVYTGLAQSSLDFRLTARNAIGSGTASAISTATPGTPITIATTDDFGGSAVSGSGGATDGGTSSPQTWANLAGTVNRLGSTGNPANTLQCATILSGVGSITVIDDGITNGQSQVDMASLPTSGAVGVMRSINADGTTSYVFFRGSTSAYQLSRQTAANAFTTIQATTGVTPAQRDTEALMEVGSAKTCRINGVTVISTSDATLTVTSRKGIYMNTPGALAANWLSSNQTT